MINSKIVKKVFISSIILASLSGLASAACDESKNSCYYGNIGIGGQYFGTFGNTTNEANLGGYGGYLNLEALSTFYRLKAEIDAKIGGGMANFSGSSLTNIGNASPYFGFDYKVKLGINVFAKKLPIYINAVAGYDDIYARYNGGLARRLVLVGGEIDGRIPLTSKLNIEYGGGYYWVAYGGYSFSNTGDDRYKPNGYSYAISANIGYSYDITDNLSYYIRLSGKYYNLKETHVINNMSYPATQSYNAMLEIGIRGFTNP